MLWVDEGQWDTVREIRCSCFLRVLWCRTKNVLLLKALLRACSYCWRIHGSRAHSKWEEDELRRLFATALCNGPSEMVVPVKESQRSHEDNCCKTFWAFTGRWSRKVVWSKAAVTIPCLLSGYPFRLLIVITILHSELTLVCPYDF